MRIFPRAGTSLFFDFCGSFAKDGEWLNRAINGFHKNFYSLNKRNCSRIDQLIVDFKPRGLAHFIKGNLSDFRESLVDADLVFGPVMKTLFDILGTRTGTPERIRILNHFFLSRLDLDPQEIDPVPWILSRLERERRILSPLETSQVSRLSYRQLERKFFQQTGSSMKEIVQAMRFETFRNLSLSRPQSKMSDLALESGFYDQPQLNKKIKEMTGLTPAQFLQSDNPCEFGGPEAS